MPVLITVSPEILHLFIVLNCIIGERGRQWVYYQPRQPYGLLTEIQSWQN